jgi:hypothetical protein
MPPAIRPKSYKQVTAERTVFVGTAKKLRITIHINREGIAPIPLSNG